MLRIGEVRHLHAQRQRCAHTSHVMSGGVGRVRVSRASRQQRRMMNTRTDGRTVRRRSGQYGGGDGIRMGGGLVVMNCERLWMGGGI